MKNKILTKLITYFSFTLILFSIIIGSIFMTLFKNHTLDMHKLDLEKRGSNIANTLSELMDNAQSNNAMHGSNKMGFGLYIKLLDDIAMTDVWIVDSNLQLLTSGHMGNRNYSYKDLPPDAEVVVNEVFKGKTNFSEGFSTLLNAPTITLGIPIILKNNIIGALLLHSPIEGIDEGVKSGFIILGISIFIAFVFSVLLSIILATSFIRPLKKMKKTAVELSLGNYDSKTNINLNDEIGELANAIDILSNKLDTASKESEKLQNLRRDFIANISHELRTPVTVIRGSLEALLDEVINEPEQIKNYHQQILKESLFLERLINDLLDLSKLQNIDFKINIQEVNLVDILNDIWRSGKNIAISKNININLELDKEIYMIRGDYGRLRQMFLIIIDNAIKFSNNNSLVVINLNHKTVSIKNQGLGISPDDLPYIFDRFYKVKSETNKQGTGLGLPIAKEIANRHNITVEVSSIEKGETEFIFIFP